MNKKFSTLLVGALLASSVGAFAQTVVRTAVNQVGHDITLRPTATASGATLTNTVSAINESVLYQLTDGPLVDGVGGNVLIQDRNYTTGELTLKLVPVADAPINASLWTIKAYDDANSGKHFVYVNKETGFELAIDQAKAVVATAPMAQAAVDGLTATTVEGCQTTWAWYATDALTAPAVFEVSPIYSYYKKEGVDHVIVLQKNQDGEIVAVDYPKTVAGQTDVSSIADAVKLQPVIADAIVLSADDLNRKVDYKYLTGDAAMGVAAGNTFTVSSTTLPTTASPLLDNVFTAEPVGTDISTATGYVADNLGITATNLEEDYVYLKTASNQYLYVSEKFFPANSKFLQLALTTAAQGKLSNVAIPANTGMTAATWLARSAFKATYYPSNDSLVFEPLNALSANPTNNVWTNGDWAFNSVNNKLAAFHSLSTVTAAADVQDYDNIGDVVIRIGNLTASESVITAYTTELDGFDMPGSLKTKFSFADRTFAYLQRATLAPNLYSIKETVTGKYVVCNFEGTVQLDAPDRYSDGSLAQDYNNMPATMWVVNATGCTTVDVNNREYGANSNAFTDPYFAGQLYVDADGNYFTINTGYTGTNTQTIDNELAYTIAAITDAYALENKRHGYKNLTNLLITKYNLAYNLFVDQDLYLDVTSDKNFAPSQSNDAFFEAEEVVTNNPFGYGAGVADLPQLVRNAYTLKVKDANLIDNDKYYVYLVEAYGENPYYYAMTAKEAAAMNALPSTTVTKAVFYLKADQVKDDDIYYVLIDINNSGLENTEEDPYELSPENGVRQAHCIDNVGRLSYMGLNNIPSQRASAFAIGSEPVSLYRTIVSNKTAKLYMQRGTAKHYLYEDSGNALNIPASNIAKGFGYLNYTSEGVHQGGNGKYTTAMYVQYVKHSNPIMPQYLFLVDVDSVADGKWCEIPGDAGHGYIQPGDIHSDHTADYTGYMSGRFLVNLKDSVEDANYNMLKDADKFKWGGYTRLGFVEGVYRIENGIEYLYLVKPGHSLKSLSAKWGVIAPETFNNTACFDKIVLDDRHSLYAFSLRLINDEAEKDFLIESKNEYSEMGSFKGAWIKEHNGTLVVLDFKDDPIGDNHVGDSGLSQELINSAQIFNIEDGLDEIATSNETIDSASAVTVVATNGAIIVKGAAGKKVAINNILGQTIANTVVTSDEATIAAPAGVVVVAVEGEAAVKAIVK